MIYVGIDWSEAHHEVEVQQSSGKVVKRLRIDADLPGLTRLQEVIAEEADNPDQVVVAIEASQGLLVNALVGSGYQVYAVNPLTSARARQGESLAGAKSDGQDAHMLANLVRTKQADLRPLAGDGEEAQAIRVRARSHVRAIRTQKRLRNQLRSALLQFYPGALPLLAEGEELSQSLAVLKLGPNPERGRQLSLKKIESALRGAGRQRNLTAKAAEIQAWLRAPQPQLNLPKLVSAYSDEVAFLVRTLLQIRSEISLLEQQLAEGFEEHPDAEIYLSLPGLAHVLGARVLAESGDDPARFSDAKARKNYAGNAPITKASGKWREVNRRRGRNNLLADSTFRWALAALTASPGARRYYDALRARGRTHNEATRALANRLVGILHGCLRRRCPYEESVAWPPPLQLAA